jgi:hypothetical protein
MAEYTQPGSALPPVCRTRRPPPRLGIGLALLLAAVVPACVLGGDRSFRITLDPAVRREPFSGRIYVFFTRQRSEPRMGPQWFNTEPFIALEVADWEPGTACELNEDDPARLTYPRDLSTVDLSGYQAQAVARFNPWERTVGTGVGNGYGPVITLSSGDSAELHIDSLVQPAPFPETEWTKELVVRSELLSRFYRRDVVMRASVVLPASYQAAPDRRYPTVFIIPGFGGTHREGVRDRPVEEHNPHGVEFLRVFLDPSCPLGHHVFADSANNGPVGQALVEELIPEFDRQYRSVAEPRGRFLTGHSSGGWSSLWLQVTDPDFFGGVWSTSPDPVDFRDFQRINIYRPEENAYVDPAGQRRPLARAGNQVLLWYDDFDWMEHVLGPGTQLHSFEAVFSPRGDDGRPRRLWDRQTGAIDPDVARTWEAYDIRLVLERNWSELGPKLQGKLHIFTGDQDTFYLDGAVVLLKESLERLGSDAVVEIQPGKDHGSILTPQFRDRVRLEMAQSFDASSQ